MTADGDAAAGGGEPSGAPRTGADAEGGRHATDADGDDGAGGRSRTLAGVVGPRPRAAWRSLAARLELRPATVRFVVGVAVVGLVARLVWLGARGAHYDEGRVAYWTLRYAKTGHFEYRYIIHGPLVQHVDRWLFALAGPSDLLARLPVALVGAALPLVALWFRDHLDDVEVAAMAGLLALNPVLLYYSRFLRSDLLVATFMLATLGALLRLHATRRPAYLYAAAAFGALGLGSKENAVVYVLCWLGAGALLLEVALFRPRGHATGFELLRTRAAAMRAAALGDGATPAPWVRRGGGHLLGAGLLFLVLTVLLFAPRAGTAGGPGLWRVLGDPGHLPRVLRATALDLGHGFGYWFGGAADAGCRKERLVAGYACYLWRMAATVARFAAATAVLAALGFLRERYAVADSRPLVLFAAFWGVASFLGYPLGTDIWAAWVATHVVVPLAIPAAVGVGVLVRLGRRGLAADRAPLVALPVVVLLVLGGWTGFAAVDAVYVDDSTRDHPADMVQYAQPERDVKPAVAAMRAAVAGHDDGPDVLYHGRRYDVGDESVADQPPVPRAENDWFHRLPLPWYLETMDATVASTRSTEDLAAGLASRPPVVVAAEPEADAVRSRVEGYRTFTVDLRAHTDGPSSGTSVVVFVDERRLDGRG